MEIKEILDCKSKSKICEDIIRALPEWFGIEQSIVDYVDGVKGLPFFAIFDGNNPIGFFALKLHNGYTAEIYVCGIYKEYHRKGVGNLLMQHCKNYCKQNNLEYLTVKTLDESVECEFYKRTRLFYLAMDFKPLEVVKTIWDEKNPCLIMVKAIKKEV